MNIGRIQRTLTAEPVVDPVPSTEPSHPEEAVPAAATSAESTATRPLARLGTSQEAVGERVG
jgi:hypothetical protein